MDIGRLVDGLITFACFIPILTFHEWAHAWTAHKCGDDTAKLLGRVSFNPLVHIDPVGTLALPFLAIALAASGPAGATAAGFIIGWGKPVPVNIARLRHRKRDDMLVAMAGPAMNVVLALAVLIAARCFLIPGWTPLVEGCVMTAWVSLYLCFFNLLPVPPLDGSHVMRHAVGMGEEAYFNLCRFGFILVIVVIQVPGVRELLAYLTFHTYRWMALPLGMA
jgi:Zn-dependent protease